MKTYLRSSQTTLSSRKTKSLLPTQELSMPSRSGATPTSVPLGEGVARPFEAALGTDFRGVRIHHGAHGAAVSQSLGAKAVTIGQDIYFNRGQFQPQSAGGKHLLAHELTHVAQQRLPGRGQLTAAEGEAQQAADSIASGQAFTPSIAAPAHMPMRQALADDPFQFKLRPPSLTFDNPNQTTTQTDYHLTGFETDSATLTATHEVILQELADSLNADPLILGGFITIWGFADSRGTESHNRQLGQRRANAVRTRLEALLTDPTTRANIRANSIGEELNEEEGDVPALRKVEITVTRRNFRPGLLAPELSNPLTPIPEISTELPERFRVPLQVPNIPAGPPNAQQLPPWFWQSISPPNRPRVDLNALSEALTDGLRQPLARGVAPLARDLAGVVGIDKTETEMRQFLNQAMIDGGEAGLKELLKMMIFAIAGRPSSAPPNEFGPPTRPFSAPGERMFSTPVIRF